MWKYLGLLWTVSALQCSTCTFFKKDYFITKYSKCTLFPNGNKTLISGETVNNYVYCSTARKFDDLCGPKGLMYKKGVSCVS